MRPAPGAPRHVLVTGAAGLIGTATTALLRRHAVAVTALVLPGSVPRFADRVVEGDTTDAAVVAEAVSRSDRFGPVDAVVHLAAIPHPSLARPETVFGTNVVGTFTVLAGAAAAGVRRAVVASSINASGLPFNSHDPVPAYFPIDEDIPADIDDAYSLSKATDERTAQMAARRWGTDVLALRFPFVGGGDRLAGAVADARRDPLATMREGWSYLDDRDAARAVFAALVATVSGAHVIGLAASDTTLDLPTMTALRTWAAGVPVRRDLPGRASGVDTARAARLLGFRPVHTLADLGLAAGTASLSA